MHIKGKHYHPIPISDFRAQFGLSDSFGIALFEPKDTVGLGRIDTARTALSDLRSTVIECIPTALTPRRWLDYVPALSAIFRDKLIAVNDQIGLRDPEIDFAFTGFSDVCSQIAYAWIRQEFAGEPIPSFASLYEAWLEENTRLGGTLYPFEEQGKRWSIRILLNPYGRVGLFIVDEDDQVRVVLDHTLACPADRFMGAVLEAVYDRVLSDSDLE